MIRRLVSLVRRVVDGYIDRRVMRGWTIFGDRSRVELAEGVMPYGVHFNTSSGSITVERYAFFGNGAKLLTGTHDVAKFGAERRAAIPPAGRDIVVREGAWVSAGAIVLGPCEIGGHAVVAAGAVVTKDVPAYAMVAGVPARVIRDLR